MSYEWQWRSNTNPLTWKCYTNLETMKIEEAYQKHEKKVLLDAYHIDLVHMIQISNTNLQKQRPIRRVTIDGTIDGKKVREERFFADPLLPTRPFMKYREVNIRSSFIQASLDHFDILLGQAISPDKRTMLVDTAADGLIIEGALAGKKHDGEEMADILRQFQQDRKNTWQCCAWLYCKESFLYVKLNEYMRLSADFGAGEVWREHVPTLGAFAILLWDGYEDQKLEQKINIVYRGANLSMHLIEQFGKQAMKKRRHRPWIEFPAFTSTSRNRSKAEELGNVLFVIKINQYEGFDMISYSIFDEEEILVKPHYFFKVRSCVKDQDRNKWIIHLA
ncbi:unnamed protein product [Rotaria sordida]|uniref:NAD(P)(+)--arginine ADP-ribosyltransferase n=1 Tax=Rotaria sordida TaxID=392033 RepID=A0A819I714_9BILA|nr:unnamed protein product [Rotaria sordida]CAF3914149.1 unnamed protein product [Rotaria sordida]